MPADERHVASAHAPDHWGDSLAPGTLFVSIWVHSWSPVLCRALRSDRNAADAGEGGPAPMVALKSGERIARVPGVAIVYTNTYTGIPAAFVNLLANTPALHQTVVFITVR